MQTLHPGFEKPGGADACWAQIQASIFGMVSMDNLCHPLFQFVAGFRTELAKNIDSRLRPSSRTTDGWQVTIKKNPGGRTKVFYMGLGIER